MPKHRDRRHDAVQSAKSCRPIGSDKRDTQLWNCTVITPCPVRLFPIVFFLRPKLCRYRPSICTHCQYSCGYSPNERDENRYSLKKIEFWRQDGWWRPNHMQKAAIVIRER